MSGRAAEKGLRLSDAVGPPECSDQTNGMFVVRLLRRPDQARLLEADPTGGAGLETEWRAQAGDKHRGPASGGDSSIGGSIECVLPACVSLALPAVQQQAISLLVFYCFFFFFFPCRRVLGHIRGIRLGRWL